MGAKALNTFRDMSNQELETLLKNETDEVVLKDVADVLRTRQDFDAKSAISILTSSSTAKRMAGITALSLYKTKEALPEIIQLLKDSDANIRDYTAARVSGLVNPDIKVLKAALDDPSFPPEVAVLTHYFTPEEAHKHTGRIKKIFESCGLQTQKAAVTLVGNHIMKEFADDVKKLAKDFPDLVIDTAVTLERGKKFAAFVDHVEETKARKVMKAKLMKEGFLQGKAAPASKKAKLPAIYSPLVKAGYADFAEKLFSHAKASVLLKTKKTADKSIEVGASKFGGQPDLALDVTWPESKGGLMAYVAQINLAELAKEYKSTLPSSGILYIFIDEKNYLNEGRKVVKTFFSKEKSAKLKRRELPKELAKTSCFPSCAIKFEECPSFPSIASELCMSLKLDEEQEEAYEKFLKKLGQDAFSETDHRMFGHANLINGDIGGNGITMLLQISSSKATGMEWAGGGRMYFLIEDSKLNSEAFDTTELQFKST